MFRVSYFNFFCAYVIIFACANRGNASKAMQKCTNYCYTISRHFRLRPTSCGRCSLCVLFFLLCSGQTWSTATTGGIAKLLSFFERIVLCIIARRECVKSRIALFTLNETWTVKKCFVRVTKERTRRPFCEIGSSLFCALWASLQVSLSLGYGGEEGHLYGLYKEERKKLGFLTMSRSTEVLDLCRSAWTPTSSVTSLMTPSKSAKKSGKNLQGIRKPSSKIKCLAPRTDTLEFTEARKIVILRRV